MNRNMYVYLSECKELGTSFAYTVSPSSTFVTNYSKDSDMSIIMDIQVHRAMLIEYTPQLQPMKSRAAFVTPYIHQTQPKNKELSYLTAAISLVALLIVISFRKSYTKRIFQHVISPSKHLQPVNHIENNLQNCINLPRFLQYIH